MMKRLKIKSLIIKLIVFLGIVLQSCDHSIEQEVDINISTQKPYIQATNISAEGKSSLSAYDSAIGLDVNGNRYEVTVNVNGEPRVFIGTHAYNELPVIGGNEVVITAVFDENANTSNICFTMPDKTKEIISKTDPICSWIVPIDFTPGEKIIGQWADKNGKIVASHISSSITLVSL